MNELEAAPDLNALLSELSAAQRKALLAFPEAPACQIGDEIVYPRQWCKASEIGVYGGTLVSMLNLGGVDPKTFECGPSLTMEDWSSEGRHWALTDLGLALRARALAPAMPV